MVEPKTYNLLISMQKEGSLKHLVQSGIISTNIPFYIEVYEFWVKAGKKHKKTTAVNITADEFNISDQSVYRIITKMC